jgi:hypothetical protein
MQALATPTAAYGQGGSNGSDGNSSSPNYNYQLPPQQNSKQSTSNSVGELGSSVASNNYQYKMQSQSQGAYNGYPGMAPSSYPQQQQQQQPYSNNSEKQIVPAMKGFSPDEIAYGQPISGPPANTVAQFSRQASSTPYQKDGPMIQNQQQQQPQSTHEYNTPGYPTQSNYYQQPQPQAQQPPGYNPQWRPPADAIMTNNTSVPTVCPPKTTQAPTPAPTSSGSDLHDKVSSHSA